MTDRNMRICFSACELIRREERIRLQKLYQLPLEELKKKEHVFLIQRAIELPLAAQNHVKAALGKAQIPYANLVWQDISKDLPSISYVYINWDPPEEEDEKPHSKIDGLKYRFSGKVGEKWKTPRSHRRHAEGQNRGDSEAALLQAQTVNYETLDAWCEKLQEAMYLAINKQRGQGAAKQEIKK